MRNFNNPTLPTIGILCAIQSIYTLAEMVCIPFLPQQMIHTTGHGTLQNYLN